MLTPEAVVVCLPELYRYACLLTRDDDRANDLVQDCATKALANLEKFRHGENPRPWLMTIMHNIFVTQIQRSRKWQGVQPIDGIEFLEPERVTNTIWCEEVIRLALTLSVKYRGIFYAIEVEGREYEEAARLFCIPVGTVKSRHHRARLKLRELMGEKV